MGGFKEEGKEGELDLSLHRPDVETMDMRRDRKIIDFVPSFVLSTLSGRTQDFFQGGEADL